MTNTSVLDAGTVNVRTVPDEVDISALIREAARTSDPEWGTSWILTASSDGMPQLMVGVRGDCGALAWYAPHEVTPADGLNDDYVDYSLADLHHTPVPPKAEQPLGHVLAAVEEFVRTGTRPTCVRWRDEPTS